MPTDGPLSRRDVLKSGVLAASMAAVPAWAKSMTHTPDDPIILGEGSNHYECIHDWIKPPEGMVFGDTHAVAQAANGDIFVGHTVNAESKSDDAICVYTKDGQFKGSWGAEFKGGSHGLDLRREGDQEFLYHCDTGRRVIVKTDLEGKVIWNRGVPAEAGVYTEGKNYIPTNIAFLPNGNLIVGDGYGSSYLHEYTKEGDYRRTIGTPGNGEGQLSSPHGLWVDSRGAEPMLAVADRGNNRIQYFDLDGKHVKFVTDKMRRPCHFDIQGGLMLIPHLDSVIALLDENGQTVSWLGDGYPTDLRGKPRENFIPGKFVHPHDAMFLQNGDILVAEWVPQGRVTLLKKLRD